MALARTRGDLPLPVDLRLLALSGVWAALHLIRRHDRGRSSPPKITRADGTDGELLGSVRAPDMMV